MTRPGSGGDSSMFGKGFASERHSQRRRGATLWTGIFASALVLLCAATSAQGPAIAIVGPVDAGPGDIAEFAIQLTDVQELGALRFDLAYDRSALTLEGIEITGHLAEQGGFASAPEVFPSLSGSVRFAFLKATGLSGNGEGKWKRSRILAAA